MSWNSSSFASLIATALIAGFAVPIADAGTVLDVGGNIKRIVADPIRDNLYASLENEVILVDIGSQSITTRVSTIHTGSVLAISRLGDRLYVGGSSSSDVQVFEIPGLVLLHDLNICSGSQTVDSLAAGEQRLYANCGSRLAIIDIITGSRYYDERPPGGVSYDSPLFISPDGSKLAHPNGASGLPVWNVSYGQPVYSNQIYRGQPYPEKLTFSNDGNEIAYSNQSGGEIEISRIKSTGVISPKRIIPNSPEIGGNVKGVAFSRDGSYLLVASASSGYDTLVYIRVSDWLLTHSLVLDGSPEELVVSPVVDTVAVVLPTPEFPPTGDNLIEFFPGTPPLPDEYGGISFRAIDDVEAESVLVWLTDGDLSIRHSPQFINIQEGRLALHAVPPGQYDLTLGSWDHEDFEIIGISVTAGVWTDLGNITMIRSVGGEYKTEGVSASPGITAGETNTISVHGRGFLESAILESSDPDITVHGFSRLDWATIEATVSVAPGKSAGAWPSLQVTNSGYTPSLAGKTMVLEPVHPILALTSHQVTTTESEIQVFLDVSRSASSSGEVTVDYQTSDGTATGGNDYTAVSDTLTWPDGDSDPKTITVPILQDALPEGPETFTVELLNPTGGAVLGAIDTTEVTIEDDDSSTVRFTVATTGINETGGTVSLTVSRNGDTSTAGSVSWATADGTAVAGSDYTSVGGTLDWAAGVGGDQAIEIDILDDTILEGPEAFTVELSSPGGNAFLGDPFVATVNISDDDVIEIVFSTAGFSVDEGDGNATITAWRTGATNGAVTADFATTGGTATAGSDYTDVSGTLSWADGDIAPKTFDVPLLEDGNGENDETVLLALSAPTGGATIGAPGTATLTIEDNDGTSLQFTTASFNVGEWEGDVIITVERVGGDTSGIATIDYATAEGTAVAGLDFLATSGTLSWADGNTDDKTFSVTILDDGVLEGSESLALELTNPTGNATLGSPVAAVITIADDEWVEQLVNTETSGPQTRPDVAMAADGRSVVVWESYLQDGAGWGIFGQRFDAAGNPAGSEFQVNSGSTGDQQYPAAAMRPDGSFSVVWLDSDGAGDGIRGRSFNSAGAPVGGDFTVNLTTTGDQTEPDVAVDGSGAGIVVWQSDATGDLEIRGRRLDSSGAPTGSELTINSTTADDQQAPAIAGAAGGGFVIVWQGYGQDGPADGIIARLFAANGTPSGAEVIANEWTAGNQISPVVGSAADGSFLVVWEDTTNKDGSGSSIRARWFSAAAAPLGGDVQANTYWLDDQMNPTVACSGPGNALIAWESEDQDGSNFGIYMQALGHDGTPSGIEQRMNTFVFGIQHRPALADSASGAFWAIWASGAQDGSGDGIYGLFSAAPVITELFADGFESGDTSAWAATTP